MSTTSQTQILGKATAADGGAASGGSGASSGSGAGGANKFGCPNSGCDVGKIIKSIPKRNATQFITMPYLQEKPIFVNGLTSVFQIQGNAAQLNDIKPVNSAGGDAPKPIYRINPDSHVHVINYIVAEDESEVVRKISEGDPETIRILQDSQRASAKQKLERLKSNHTVKEVNALVTRNGSGSGANVKVTPLGSDLQLLSETSTPGKIKSSLRNQHALPPHFEAPTSSTSVASEPEMPLTFDQMQKQFIEIRQTLAELAAQKPTK